MVGVAAPDARGSAAPRPPPAVRLRMVSNRSVVFVCLEGLGLLPVEEFLSLGLALFEKLVNKHTPIRVFQRISFLVRVPDHVELSTT